MNRILSTSRCAGLAALAVGMISCGLAKADVVAFNSDNTWNTYDANPSGPANLLGTAEYIADNASRPANQPAGTVVYGYPFLDGKNADLSTIPAAHWIWGPNITGASLAPDFQKYFFSKTIQVTGTPTAGTIKVAADDLVQVFVNGTSVGTYGSVVVATPGTQNGLQTFNILPFLVGGANTITIMGENGPATFSALTTPGVPATYSQNPAGVVFGGSITSVPEPASLSVLALGGLLMLRRRR